MSRNTACRISSTKIMEAWVCRLWGNAYFEAIIQLDDGPRELMTIERSHESSAALHLHQPPHMETEGERE